MVSHIGIIVTLLVLNGIIAPGSSYAMHIMEGFLPPAWNIAWGVIAAPFVIRGFFSLQKKISENPRLKMLLAMAGAFAFVLSALKMPSVTGSCSHPTGVGLGAILFGPTAMSVVGLIVLLFQALLLAHGGLTTLGANVFSLAVAGPFIAFVTHRLLTNLHLPQWFAVFAAAALGDLLTYITTAVQLALAFPAETGGFTASLVKFLGIFALTQIPLAISEGILTVMIFKAIAACAKDDLPGICVLSKEA